MLKSPSPSSWAPLWDMVDGPMPRGLLGLGDPDVHLIGGVPTMFLGGFSTTLRNRLYTAQLVAGGDPAGADWRLLVDHRGRPRPLTADPPRGAWDRAGMHTPSYVSATDRQPARIYYSGRSSLRQYGAGSSYAIGVLEQVDGQWRRRPEPVLRGTDRRPSVLEPLVTHDGDRYLMWFQANRHEIAPGEQPDHELRVSESVDGIHWDRPQAFAPAEENFFDNTVVRTADGWLMLLARSGDLHGTGGFPPQGLWACTATELSPDRGRWSEPHHVVRTDDPATPAALARGCYGPGALHTTAEPTGPDPTGRDRTIVYATGVRDTPPWPRLLRQRLLRRQRPVVPAPFYLSVSAVELIGA